MQKLPGPVIQGDKLLFLITFLHLLFSTFHSSLSSSSFSFLSPSSSFLDIAFISALCRRSRRASTVFVLVVCLRRSGFHQLARGGNTPWLESERSVDLLGGETGRLRKLLRGRLCFSVYTQRESLQGAKGYSTDIQPCPF